MSLVTIIAEMKRFIRSYLTKIIMGALLVSLVVMTGRYYTSTSPQSFDEKAYRYLENVYAQQPAIFKFVVTNEDGTMFGNSFLIDDYLSQMNVVQQIESQTGISFSEWLESEKALELTKTSQFRGGLAGIRDTSSDVITLRVLVGQSAEENLTIAKAYANFLKDGKVPFLQNKTLLFLGDIETIEEKVDVNNATVGAVPESLNIYSQISARSFIIYGIIGVIVGAIVTTFILIAKRLGQSNIDYAFEYVWELEDTHIMSVSMSDEETMQLWQVPHHVKRVVVSEELSNSWQTQENVHYVTDIAQLFQAEMDEIVLIIQAKQTTKQWYAQQSKLARLYKVPIKLIHIVK